MYTGEIYLSLWLAKGIFSNSSDAVGTVPEVNIKKGRKRKHDPLLNEVECHNTSSRVYIRSNKFIIILYLYLIMHNSNMLANKV